MVGTMMTGCANDDDTIEVPQTENPNKTVTVTMTTTLSREGDDGATTRALDAAGHKTFAADDQIAVIYKNTSNQTVKAVSSALQDNGDITNSGKKAAFTVTLTDPAPDGAVRYIYPAAMAKESVATSADVNSDDATVDFTNLEAQDGTLATLATNYDLAVYDGTLTSDAALPSGITLSNQLAILELTVKNASGTPVNSSVTKLSVFDGTNVYKISRTTGNEPIYVALRPITSDKTIHFCATNGTTNYRKSVTGKTLERNNIYPVNLSTTETTGTALEFLTANYTAQDGDILSGILLGKYYITTAQTTTDAAAITVTLDGVDINHNYTVTSTGKPGIYCQGNTNLVLAAGSVNHVTACTTKYAAGIAIKSSRTLTISGSGSLTATGKGRDNGYGGAGIGGSHNDNAGNVVITGGTITATGGYGAAGIGCGGNNNTHLLTCGNISISGGTITATGGIGGAGIGSGMIWPDNGDGDNKCGNITITGGTITATGGSSGAGIGGGYSAGSEKKGHVICGTITITSGVTRVTATKGSGSFNSIGEGKAGSGGTQNCGTITIGGTVYWEGSSYQNGGDTYLTTSPLTYPQQ